MTIAQAIDLLSRKFAPLYPDEQHQPIPQQVWWALTWITGKSHAELLSHKEALLSEQEVARIELLIQQHCQEHKPLQYLIGSVPFVSLDIAVRPPTLIPRPETEYWCSWLIERFTQLRNQQLTILDLCTGTGCVALSLAHALPEAQAYSVDIAPEACALARENALSNKISQIEVIESDLFTALPSGIKFDLIVGNPPYISKNEWETLEAGVKQWEDPRSLIASDEGLGLLEAIITQAPAWLTHNKEMESLGLPEVVVEIGYQQGEAVAALFKKAGYENIVVNKDQAGKDRFVTARSARKVQVEKP